MFRPGEYFIIDFRQLKILSLEKKNHRRDIFNGLFKVCMFKVKVKHANLIIIGIMLTVVIKVTLDIQLHKKYWFLKLICL